jgi:hypothetical protein
VDLAHDVPQREVNSRDGGGADDSIAVPEMLAEHHLPEVLHAGGILADEQLRNVLDRADHRAGVPFERCFAPAIESGLVGEDFDEDPVSHAGVADERFDFRNFHNWANGGDQVCLYYLRGEFTFSNSSPAAFVPGAGGKYVPSPSGSANSVKTSAPLE